MSTKVVTGLVRFSYAHVFEPQSMEGSDTKKYSASLIIPKSDKVTLKKVEDAIAEALELGKTGKFGGKIPANYKNPLRDGDLDRPDDEAYIDSMFINANSLQAPQVVDASVNPILDREEFYSGCYGRASVTFYAYNSNGSKGIAAGLQNVQKLKDGEKLSGGSSAAEDFGDMEESLI